MSNNQTTSDSVSQRLGRETQLGRRLAYFSPVAVIMLFLLSGPTFLRPDLVSLLMKIIIFALLAMSLDLVFGYSGLWSFGHAGLFGVAAYTVAMLVIKAGIGSFWVVAPIGVAMAVVVSALFAVFGLRSREIYFMLITFAFGQLISVAAQTSGTAGGSNGIWNVPYPDLGFGLVLSKTSFYYFVLVILLISAVVLARVTKSPFGYSLMGIRDNEVRAKALGYNTWRRRFIIFLISGFFAGVAGVLYVFYNYGISPDQVGLDYSGLIIMMLIIGGVGTLWGGLVGSTVILLLQYVVSLYTAARWPLILGALFIAAVFLAGNGIFPRVQKWWKRICRYEQPEGSGSANAPREVSPSDEGA